MIDARRQSGSLRGGTDDCCRSSSNTSLRRRRRNRWLPDIWRCVFGFCAWAVCGCGCSALANSKELAASGSAALTSATDAGSLVLRSPCSRVLLRPRRRRQFCRTACRYAGAQSADPSVIDDRLSRVADPYTQFTALHESTNWHQCAIVPVGRSRRKSRRCGRRSKATEARREGGVIK